MADCQRKSSSFKVSLTVFQTQVRRDRRRVRGLHPRSCRERTYAGCYAREIGLANLPKRRLCAGIRGPEVSAFEVGVAVELVLVEALHRLGLGERHAPLLDGALAVPSDPGVELVRVVLHV